MREASQGDAPLVWLVRANSKQTDGEAALVRSGFRVVNGGWSSPEIARKKKTPPAVVVVDLSRSPSQGRDTAVAMRSHRVLVDVPFLLIGGTDEQISRLRALLPDALRSSWERIGEGIRKAIKSPPSGGRQLSVFDAYAALRSGRNWELNPAAESRPRTRPTILPASLASCPMASSFHRRATARAT